MDIYTPSQVPRYSNRPNSWTRSRINQPATSQGVICLVSPVSLGVWKVILYAPLEQFPPWPETIQDVFKLWGCTWLWKNIRWQGELDWLVQSIQRGDCMAVADGSYMPEIRTDLCSTAFFFECKAGRGRVVGSFADFNTAANIIQGGASGTYGGSSDSDRHSETAP